MIYLELDDKYGSIEVDCYGTFSVSELVDMIAEHVSESDTDETYTGSSSADESDGETESSEEDVQELVPL